MDPEISNSGEAPGAESMLQPEEAVSISTLWASLTAEETGEITESNANPLAFERLHGIVPQNHPIKKHSGLYKPEKVCA